MKTTDLCVTDAPYFAKGDGVTNDRAAIQKAIDDVSASGGGTVRLTKGHTFVSGNLMIRSGVTLLIDDGTTLLQSENPNDFVNPLKNYEPYKITLGQYVDDTIEWNAAAYYQFPFLYIGEGTKNVKITGHGTVMMSPGNDPAGAITMMIIGIYKAEHFEISDITIRRYYAYCTSAHSSRYGLFRNLTIDLADGVMGGTDGISLCGCEDIRVTGCNLHTGDDGVYMSQCVYDPRDENIWYRNEPPMPTRRIEIDHNHCEVYWKLTKAFCMIMWGAPWPDQREVEVSDVYVHDNYFETMGAWTGNWDREKRKFDFNGSTNAMKNIRFENNEVGSYQDSFFTLPISDVYGYHCMPEIKNGNFETNGDVWWVSRTTGSAKAGAVQETLPGHGSYYGCISALDSGDASLFEGIYLEEHRTYVLSADVKADADGARLFVRDQERDELIAGECVKAGDWKLSEVTFRVPKSGNYHVGLERGDAKTGSACIDNVTLTVR